MRPITPTASETPKQVIARYMANNGRKGGTKARGKVKAGRAKLSEDDVRLIRSWQPSPHPGSAILGLSLFYGVTLATIYRIRNGTTWKWVE